MTTSHSEIGTHRRQTRYTPANLFRWDTLWLPPLLNMLTPPSVDKPTATGSSPCKSRHPPPKLDLRHQKSTSALKSRPQLSKVDLRHQKSTSAAKVDLRSQKSTSDAKLDLRHQKSTSDLKSRPPLAARAALLAVNTPGKDGLVLRGAWLRSRLGPGLLEEEEEEEKGEEFT